MKLKSLLIALFVVWSTFPVAAQERTVVNDNGAAKMLLGRHMLSLQWISWEKFGTAVVTNKLGVYGLEGEQRGPGGDYLKIAGMIVSIDAREFKFQGTITTRVSHINNGQPCERQGDFTFKVTGKRKYWRLQEMDNPCDEATDYVDIYFR